MRVTDSKNISNTLSSRIVLLLILLAPIFITPWWNFDPINLPRLLLLTSLALPLSFLGVVNLNKKFFKSQTKFERFVISLSAIFLLSALFSYFLSGSNLILQLYGTQGRNSGLIAYCSIVLLLFGIYMSNPKIKDIHLLTVVSIAGTTNLIYGLFQSFEIDFINWQNPYGPVVGMTGNPNFMSSFLGLYGIFLVSLILWRKTDSVFGLLGYLLLFSISIFVLLKTGSVQGFFVLGIGVSTLILLRMRLTLLRVSILVFFFLAILSVTLMGVGGRGPLSTVLFQNTLQVRVFFWEAAWNLIKQRPLIGYGWDTFGDWYKTARSLESTQLYGTGLVTNSAHNLFLDVGVSGGLICMFTLLIICILVTVRCLHFKWKVINTDWQFSLHFAMWVGFLSQTLISVNSILISIWGFTFGAMALVASNKLPGSQEFIERNANKGRLLPVKLGVFFFLTLGLFITTPSLMSDHRFRVALGESRGDMILETVNQYPTNDFRLVVAANIFYRNNLNEYAKSLVRKALILNPRNLDALGLLLKDPTISTSEKEEIKRKIIGIDRFAILD